MYAAKIGKTFKTEELPANITAIHRVGIDVIPKKVNIGITI